MFTIYFTTRPAPSHEFLFAVLERFYGVTDRTLRFTKNGKPYLADDSLFFSLSHSGEVTALAVGKTEVGLDVERTRTLTGYTALLSRLNEAERKEIKTETDFLRHWTARESFVKFTGDSLFSAFDKIAFVGGRILKDGAPMPAFLKQGELFTGCAYTLCVAEETPVEIKNLSNSN